MRYLIDITCYQIEAFLAILDQTHHTGFCLGRQLACSLHVITNSRFLGRYNVNHSVPLQQYGLNWR